MKRIYTMIAAMAVCAFSLQAQPVLTGGFGTDGLGIVNGATYTKTGTLGNGGYPFVSASNDGSKFFVSSPSISKLYFVGVSSSTFIDSIGIYIRNLASSNETNILFGITDKSLCRINTSTKSVIDSVLLGAPWQLQERPGSKEVWVSDSGKIHVVDYNSGLMVTTYKIAPSPYDYGIVQFTPGGSIAYKSASVSKKLYKINAVTKALIDSVNTAPYGYSNLVVSRDSSKLFICNPTNGKVMVYNTSDLSVADSISCGTRVPINIYRHPTRAEIWVVHHFQDSITVLDENTKAQIAAFRISGSPWYIAFSSGTTGIGQSNVVETNISVFPNPSSSNVIISLPDNKPRQIILSDNFGRILLQKQATTVRMQIDISAFPTGNYYFTIVKDNGVEKVIKWLKL